MTPKISEMPRVNSSDLHTTLGLIEEPTVVCTYKKPRFVVLPVNDYAQLCKCANVQKGEGA